MVHGLLWMDPNYRLGSAGAGGVASIKNYPFFSISDDEPHFIPSLEGEEDTSYFDGIFFNIMCVIMHTQ